VLAHFRKAVRRSVAVICRPLAQVKELASSDNALYATFYQLIHAGTRLPAENVFDRHRESVDSNLFPIYKDHIRFAALSLDGKGVDSYGGFSVVLRSNTIESRATVYEENTFLFFERHGIGATQQPPLGYRTVWAERDKLAAAKLHHEFQPSTRESQFPGILLKSTGDTKTDDFVEVHIYGPVNRRSIDRVIGKRPRRRPDQVMLADLRRKLKIDGATIRVKTYK
jgi:hypothetical protein